MFRKENCLTKNKEFDEVFSQGKNHFSSFLGIKILKNNLNTCRFGVLVSTKISKKAVLRNKIRRRIREAVKKQFDNLKPGFDIVVLTKPEIVEKKFSEIEQAIINVFKRAKILK